MSDLISRQTAIDAVEHITSSMSVCVNTDECHGMKRMQRQAIIELANLPSVQPEIIRCKDCKHQMKEWREDKRFKDNGYWVYGCKVISDSCGYWALFGQDDEFCSDAERREE